MDNAIIDSKLKLLIEVCKQTGNFKKLAIISFILTSNKLDEIGIKLGIRPRKKSKENIFQYMRLINGVLEDNLKMILFNKEMITSVKEIEIQFLKREGDIPFQYIVKIIDVYYDLRKLDIPNLHKGIDSELVSNSASLKMYSFFSSGSKKKRQNKDKITPLILQKIREKELLLQRKLEEGYNKDLFKRAIHLKKVKDSIKEQEKGKIVIEGSLKDNINYQRSLDDIVGYCLLGAFISFFLLSLVIIIETIIFPYLTGPLGILLLMFLGPSALFFTLYWNYFLKEEG